MRPTPLHPRFTPAPLALAAAMAVALAAGHAPSAYAQSGTADGAEAVLPVVKVQGNAMPGSDSLMTQQRPASVGKSAVSVQDTPFSITVIDVNQIRDTGAKTVEDTLLYSAGVYAGRYGFDTRGDWAAIRGLNTSTYLDGLRGIYGFYNNVRPEIYTLSSIEVLKGPSSVLYGQADLGGIVNAVSKKPLAVAAREVELQFGSHQRKQLAADFTGPLNADKTLLYRLIALKRDSNTQVDFVHDDALLINPSLTWQPNADTRLTAQFIHQQNDSRVSSQFLPTKGTLAGAPLGQIPSSRFVGEPGWDRYDTEKNELSLSWESRLSDTWKLLAIARQTKSASVTREIWAQVGSIPDDAGTIPRTVYSADRQTDVFATDWRAEADFKTGAFRHQLAIGLDYQDALWEEYNFFSQNGLGPKFNLYAPVYGTLDATLAALPLADQPDNTIRQTGVYMIDHVSWGRWHASLALRHDQARNSVLNIGKANTVVNNSATTGRLGVMYQFDNGVSPYVSFSNAFAPNLGTDGTGSGNYLKPTTGEQKEMGVKYLSNSGNTSAAFAWFDIEQKNRIVDGSTPGGREQIGSVTQGWELEVRQRWGGLELQAAYMQLSANNQVTGKRLSAIPERNASGWAQYRFANGWRAGAGARYIGNLTGNAGVPVVPSVSLFDAMVGYTLGAWDLRLDVKNLADKEYVSWCRGLNQDCGYGGRLNAGLTARYRY